MHGDARRCAAGQVRGVVLESGRRRAAARDPASPRSQRLFDETVGFWQSWLAAVDLHRPLARDGAALGDHAQADDLRARPAAWSPRRPPALPEQVGGERNWDYRYTWVRDASFSVYALLRPGLHRGGRGVRRLAAATGSREQVGSDGGPLNIMYRVDGSSDLTEEILDHWEGYRGSRPVRIGNGAADQLQLDIYGEALDSIYFADQHGLAARRTRAGRRSAERPRLAGRQLGPARGGHLGDPRRPQGLHLRPGDVLGRLRPRHPAGRRARAGRRRWSGGPPSATPIYDQVMEPRLERRAAGVRAALRRPTCSTPRCCGCRRSGFIAPQRPDVAVDAGGDGRRAGHRQPRLPLRPGAPRPTGCAARRARSRCARSATSTRWPAPAGSTTPG